MRWGSQTSSPCLLTYSLEKYMLMFSIVVAIGPFIGDGVAAQTADAAATPTALVAEISARESEPIDSATEPAATPDETMLPLSEHFARRSLEYEAALAETRRAYLRDLRAMRSAAAKARDLETAARVKEAINGLKGNTASKQLSVVSATWGIPSHTVDVPQRIRIRGNTAVIPINTRQLGDPVYGSPKFLDVTLRYDGQVIHLHLPEATRKHTSASVTLVIEPDVEGLDKRPR